MRNNHVLAMSFGSHIAHIWLTEFFSLLGKFNCFGKIKKSGEIIFRKFIKAFHLTKIFEFLVFFSLFAYAWTGK